MIVETPDGTPSVKEVFPDVRYSPSLPPVVPLDAPNVDGERIQPLLRDVIRSSRPDERVEVLITFRETLKLPYFPKALGNEPLDSPANRLRKARREQLVSSIQAQRNAKNGSRHTAFAARYGVNVLETFWLADVWHAYVPAGMIEALAHDPEIQHVEVAASHTPPPANGTVKEGRVRMNSDWFANTTNIFFSFSYVRIALLDSGVRNTHAVFTNPSHLGHWRDCVNGTSNNCQSGQNLNPNDDYWNHGTPAAAVIAGNTSYGDNYTGVTKCKVDSYKIYDMNGLVEVAAQRAFAAAVAEGAWVIAAEIQSPTTFTGSIATAAENAFDAGVVVVGATGNSDVVSAVAAPANAHKVMGIGGEYARGGGTIPVQVSGPTTDGRLKPDVQAPSYVTTASALGDNDMSRLFNGTSGATAFAAAAAGLFHRWMCDSTAPDCGSPIPGAPYGGRIYAAMIAYGTQSYPFQNTLGAGPLKMMGSYGWENYGYVTVQNGQTVTIDHAVYPRTGYSPNEIQIGIWWPENASQTHNRVHLRLLDPSGNQVRSSTHATSVFQRVSLLGPLAYGVWKVQFVGDSISVASQPVAYWVRVRGGA